ARDLGGRPAQGASEAHDPRPRDPREARRDAPPRAAAHRAGHEALLFGRVPAGSARGTRVADREHLPLGPVGFVPVDVPVLRVDLHVDGAADRAAIGDPRGANARQDRVEIALPDPEAEMMDREGFVGVLEVEGQALVYVYRRERAGPRFRPRD